MNDVASMTDKKERISNQGLLERAVDRVSFVNESIDALIELQISEVANDINTPGYAVNIASHKKAKQEIIIEMTQLKGMI